MGTREQLSRRSDVDDRDIDDIIEIAARLQDADETANAHRASVDQVREIAAELDIDPTYIDAAIHQLESDREQQAAAEVEAAEQTRKTLAFAGLGATAVVGTLVVIGLFVTAATLGLAFMGDSALDAALAEQDRTAANLETVYERQASLAPQIVALAGGDGQAVSQAADQLRAADSMDARAKASDALALAMAEQLGGQNPSQALSDLRHEATGITNRITVEKRRYLQATQNYEAAQDTFSGSLAQSLGLHP